MNNTRNLANNILSTLPQGVYNFSGRGASTSLGGSSPKYSDRKVPSKNFTVAPPFSPGNMNILNK